MSTIYTRLVRMDEGWSDVLEKVVMPEVGEVFTAWTWDEAELALLVEGLDLLADKRETLDEDAAGAALVRTLSRALDGFIKGEDDGQCIGCYDYDCPECILRNVTRED